MIPIWSHGNKDSIKDMYSYNMQHSMEKRYRRGDVVLSCDNICTIFYFYHCNIDYKWIFYCSDKSNIILTKEFKYSTDPWKHCNTCPMEVSVGQVQCIHSTSSSVTREWENYFYLFSCTFNPFGQLEWLAEGCCGINSGNLSCSVNYYYLTMSDFWKKKTQCR